MSLIHATREIRVAGISGSPVPYSTRSRLLLIRALDRLVFEGATGPRLIELSLQSSEGLLGRGTDPSLDRALRDVAEVDILVVATPIRRGAYSALLRLFFDLLPQSALQGKVALPIAVGDASRRPGGPEHALRPVLAGLGARVLDGDVYGTEDEFTDGNPSGRLVEAVDRAVTDALGLVRAFA